MFSVYMIKELVASCVDLLKDPEYKKTLHEHVLFPALDYALDKTRFILWISLVILVVVLVILMYVVWNVRTMRLSFGPGF